MMEKLGIYLQVPFCQTKCTYCNFHTGVVATSRFAPYVEADCREIRGHRELLRAAGVDWRAGFAGKAHSQEGQSQEDAADTVDIGDGTPSLLHAAHLQKHVNAIRAPLAGNLEETG